MKANSNLWYEITPEIKLDDVVLPESMRLQITQLIKEQHQSNRLHEYNLRASSMVLISGETGNGKTRLAEAIAYELMYPMIKIRYDKLIGGNSCEAFGRFCEVVDYAKTGRFVLFVDAFEIFGKNLELKAALTSVLDDLPDHVVLVAENSYGGRMPAATLRRFHLHLYLPEPTKEQKIEYIASIGRRCGVDFGDVHSLLGGWSFAETERMCIDAIRAMRLSN